MNSIKTFGTFIIFLYSMLSHADGIKFDISAVPIEKDLRNVLSMLPITYLDAVQGQITIKVKSLSSDKFMTNDLCKMGERAVFAYALKKGKNHDIVISSKFIDLKNSNKNKFDCSHKTFQEMFNATLIHELTHVKDNFEKISTDPDFQRVVGVRHVGNSGNKKVMNQNAASSPDAYEFKNLKEALAVNTEYLVMDSEFECRKPATANFLSKKLGIPLQGKCLRNYKILTQSSYLEENFLGKVSINPKNIYQIHYLFAGKGKAAMSRWGHAMFRLVVCAPHRKVAGPECLSDVSHHVVLSYRAYMNDMNVNYVKGMFGDYPSQMFVYRFHEIQQEYTKFELRDIFSVPLKMNQVQKKEFLDLTLERFWTYQGKYYFTDNNCGTESKKHLAVALDEDQSKLIRSVTPYKIFKDLSEETNDLTDGETKVFKSLSLDLNNAFKVLQDADLFKKYNFASFVKRTSAKERLEAYEGLLLEIKNLPVQERKTLIFKINFLERYLATKYSLELPSKAFEKINKDAALKDEVMKMGESLKTLFMQPWQVVNAQYGVPTFDEFENQYPRFVSDRHERLKVSEETQLSNLQSLLKIDTFKKELKELEDIKNLKVFINQQLINLSF